MLISAGKALFLFFLFAWNRPPFEERRYRHDAASPLECGPEARLFGNCLSPGTEGVLSDLVVLTLRNKAFHGAPSLYL